jgi:hypothetical protein
MPLIVRQPVDESRALVLESCESEWGVSSILGSNVERPLESVGQHLEIGLCVLLSQKISSLGEESAWLFWTHGRGMYPDAARITWLAAFVYLRARSLTDDLVDLLIERSKPSIRSARVPSARLSESCWTTSSVSPESRTCCSNLPTPRSPSPTAWCAMWCFRWSENRRCATW